MPKCCFSFLLGKYFDFKFLNYWIANSCFSFIGNFAWLKVAPNAFSFFPNLVPCVKSTLMSTLKEHLTAFKWVAPMT